MRIDLSFLNSEWYREELSPLETTLRLPEFVKQALYLFAQRFIIPTLISGTFTLYLLKRWQLHLGLIIPLLVCYLAIIFILEHFKTQGWWLNKVLPKHLNNVEKIKKLYESSKSSKVLIKAIEKSIKLSSWGMIRTAYYGIYTYSWEFLLKVFYALWIKGTKKDYKFLLVGFPNKATEADSRLWEISREKDNKKIEDSLKRYLEEFGSRIIDADLKHPTLREQPQVVESLLNLYKSLPESPGESVKRAATKRSAYQKEALNNLRFNFFKPFFIFILKQAQINVKHREDRRFYEFLADYYIRSMILRLASKLNLKESENVFNLKWKSIKEKAQDEEINS